MRNKDRIAKRKKVRAKNSGADDSAAKTVEVSTARRSSTAHADEDTASCIVEADVTEVPRLEGDGIATASIPSSVSGELSEAASVIRDDLLVDFEPEDIVGTSEVRSDTEILREIVDRGVASAVNSVQADESVSVATENMLPPPYTENARPLLYSELRQALSDLRDYESVTGAMTEGITEGMTESEPTAPPMLEVEQEESPSKEKARIVNDEDQQQNSYLPPNTETTAACLPQMSLHRKIHTRLEDAVLRPFTEAQLKALYRNFELEANEQFVADFVAKNLHPDSHAFQELVAGYLRSRVALMACTRSFEELKRDYQSRVDCVWETVEQVVEGKGLCLDKTPVRGQHRYSKAVYNVNHSAELHRLLKNMQSTLHETYALHAYELEMSRLQIESYLHRLLDSIPELKDIPRNAPILVYVDGRRPPQLSVHIGEVKRCVAILFSFQRKPLNDAHSLQDTRTWLTRLVSVVLRLGTFEDHLFLLNHVLRCPAGIKSWATGYVQVPLPYAVVRDHVTVHDPHLDHILTVLATILLPIRAREEFLQHLNMGTSAEAIEENHWVMVDSEGEEDEDPTNRWLHWRENDLVALLNQIPIGSVFRCLLRVHSSDEVDHYDVRSASDVDLIHVFAFATHLIHLLRIGLKTFHLARYRQFAKRISQLIRHTVLYVSNHWEQFLLANPDLPTSTRQRLHLEYDQFFLRAVYSIFFSQRLGAWQFMAALPYDCVSIDMLWKILWLLHMDYREELDAVEDGMATGDWKRKLEDVHLRLTFEAKLSKMPPSEAFYLLTAFANMACSRESQDSEMIETICWEIFQISFLNENTKELCSKWGRELLFTISRQHPFVISGLLEEVRSNMEKLGKISIYLFCELPVYLWEPSAVDVDTIVLWLMEYAPSSAENRLARIILTSMNWDFNEQADDLFLDISLHRRIALSVVQSYRKHSSLTTGGFVSERFKQVAAALRKDDDPEEAFSSWAWQMLMSLRLHVHQQPPVRLLNCTVDVTVPDLNQPIQLGDITWSFRQKHPLAIFVAFAMTNIGHNVTYLYEKLEYLETLVELQYFEAALHIVCLVTPLFFNSGHYLWSSKRFLAVVQGIFNWDTTYMKMAKSFVFAQFPGRILQCFAGLIEYQIQISSKVGWDLKCVLLFWTELFTSHPLWYKSQSVLYLLDVVFRAAFHENADDSRDVLAKKFSSEASSQGAGGSLTSFVSWLATGAGVPFTFVPKTVGSKFLWLSYYALEMEVESEHQMKLWKNTLRQLAANSSLSPEAALRKAASNSEDLLPPPVRHLPIYRWAELVLEVPLDHPLLPLVWQKFFALFLQRVPQTARSSATLFDCGSVGERFFCNTTDLSLFKKLKRRLDELASRFTKTTTESAVCQDINVPKTDVAQLANSELETRYRSAVLNDKLMRIYRTFYLWLEEPRLHDPSPYLPSLPAEYEPSRLLILFHNSQERWLEFVDVDRIQSERKVLLEAWCGRSLQTCRRPGWKMCANRTSIPKGDAGVEDILKRLQSYEAPLSAPCIPPLKSVVPDLPENAFASRKTLLEATRPHLTSLTGYASQFSDRVAGHLALDCNYMELLPDLYCNIEAEVRLKVRCGRGDVDDKQCLGPALIVMKFKEKKIVVSVEHKLEHNRTEWRLLLNESLIGPPMNVCSGAVFVENAIGELLKKYRSLGNDVVESAAKLRDVGVNLFYHMCGLLDSDTELYPPTRQFLTSCVEILGQELVRKNGDQCDHLLRLILSCPRLVGILAPHFCPNMADIEIFLELYGRVTRIHRENGTDLAFVVLSKFNVKSWLDTSRPRLAAREKIVEAIGNALTDLGHEPPPELAGIGELYRRHLATVLLHQFPDMYRNIFALLVTGTDLRGISTDVWYDVLNALVNGEIEEFKDRLSADSSIETVCSISCNFAQKQQLFSLQLIRETLRHLGDTYMEKRVSTKETLLRTLYNDYTSYAKPILIFAGLMGHAYVACVKRESSSSSSGALSVAELGNVWNVLQSVFAPWTLPIQNHDKLWLPWVPDQEPLAVVAVSLFGSCVQFTNATLYALGSFMSPFLEMYALELARPLVEDHVLILWHNVFIHLPWTTFWPNPLSIGIMMTILNSGKSECLTFLGKIFIQIGWPQVVHHIVQHESSSTIHRTMDSLLHLYVCLGLRMDTDQEVEMQKLMESAHTHPWELVDSKSYDNAMRWFLSDCNPVLIIKESSILSLLRSAAEFVPGSGHASFEVTAKRATYVRSCIHMLCECASKNGTLIRTRMELFKDVVLSLMKETEVVLVTGPNREHLFETAVVLVTEILNVLNLASVACLQDLSVKAIQDWARAYPRSPIFGAVLHVTFRSLASVTHMAVLVEALVESYFSIDLDLCIAGNGWSFLLSVIEIPQLTEESLVAECLGCGHYLTLKALAALLLVDCKSVEEEHAVLTRVIDWVEKARPTEDNEHKLLLLWWISLEGVARMQSSLTPVDVAKLLTSFASAIQPLGEDKTSQGFWATIGLGKKSPCSPRFRFVARCVTAFVLVQAKNLDVDSDAASTRRLQSALSLLESTRTSRQYVDYREYLERVFDYVQRESYTLRDGAALLGYLSRLMYPGQHCLSVLIS